MLFASRIVQGLGGGTTGVAQAYVADAMEPGERAKALGWLSAATSAGVVIGPVVGSVASGPRSPGWWQAAGKVWLFSLGPKRERSQGGTFVAEIGPVPPVPPAASYVLEVLEAEHGPDVSAEVARRVHIHPGPEIFYLLAGEQCLEAFPSRKSASARCREVPGGSFRSCLRR
jgi:MFS family permease